MEKRYISTISLVNMLGFFRRKKFKNNSTLLETNLLNIFLIIPLLGVIKFPNFRGTVVVFDTVIAHGRLDIKFVGISTKIP